MYYQNHILEKNNNKKQMKCVLNFALCNKAYSRK